MNWYMVDAGREGVTLVDAGLPSYHRHLEASLHEIGRSLNDVRALVMTHGHIDHSGMAPQLAEAGVKLFLRPEDAELVANPRSNRTEKSLLPYLRYPATLAFVAHAVAYGALKSPRHMPRPIVLSEGEIKDIPGLPVVTHTPGHTEGSCVLDFREHGVALVGDLLCTASPVTGRHVDPQLQTRGSNQNSAQAMASLERVSGVQSKMVLPGHGRPWTSGIEAAAESARQIGCR